MNYQNQDAQIKQLKAAEAQHAQQGAELEQQASDATAAVSAAQAEVEKANDTTNLRYSDKTPVLAQSDRPGSRMMTGGWSPKSSLKNRVISLA